MSSEAVKLDVEGFPKEAFEFCLTSAGDENAWIGQTVKVLSDGSISQDHALLNRLKACKLVKVPWTLLEIEGACGVQKEWSSLSDELKWKVLSKLKPAVFDCIIRAINLADKGDDVKKKD